MYLVKNEKIEVKLNIYIKIYADNSTLKHKNKSKIISNRTSRLLFLRSPKHFKTGKQILKKKELYYNLTVILKTLIVYEFYTKIIYLTFLKIIYLIIHFPIVRYIKLH